MLFVVLMFIVIFCFVAAADTHTYVYKYARVCELCGTITKVCFSIFVVLVVVYAVVCVLALKVCSDVSTAQFMVLLYHYASL